MNENIRTWIPPITEGTQHLEDDYEDFHVDLFVFVDIYVYIDNTDCCMYTCNGE